MQLRIPHRVLATAAALTVLGGCDRDVDVLEPAPFPSDAVVFDDGFASGVNFQAFQGSKLDAVQIDPSDTYQGSASLRITVPTPTDPTGSFAGGAFTSNTPRDLSEYNALTFWAKAATPATLNVAGIGNDNTGTSLYQAETGGFALTTGWQKFVVPLPLPEKLDREGGLFFFAEGAENNQANVIWFDEIQFEKLEGLGMPQPAVETKSVSLAVGESTQANGTVTFDVGGSNVVMTAFPSYFTWSSSNPAVASVSEAGLITMVAEGTADITATLGSTTATGAVTVSSGAGLAGLVFGDDFGDGVDYQAFAGSKTDAVQIDDTQAQNGSKSLKITIPVPSDPTGSYAGGAFVAGTPWDLSSYNALTFWAKAATPATLNVAGIGNDNTGTSLYQAETGGFALTNDWQKFTVPLPLPAKLDGEKGLFFFAEGAENDQANTFWFDEIRFEDVAGLGAPQPAVATRTVTLSVGGTTQAEGTVTFDVGGSDVVMKSFPSYFAWSSSDTGVATVSESGLITLVADGTADITATLGAVAATGAVTVQSGSAAGEPAEAAPTPTQEAANVISLFSDAYTDETVDRWASGFAGATTVLEDVTVAGNATKKYSTLNYEVVEFVGANSIDASGMTHFRMDIWTPNATEFGVKLVDFGADNAFGGGDDSEARIVFDASSTPSLDQGTWISLDIPLSQFSSLNSLANLSQLIIDGVPVSEVTVYVDNVYFYK